MTILPSLTSAEQILFVRKQVSAESHLEKSQWKGGGGATGNEALLQEARI